MMFRSELVGMSVLPSQSIWEHYNKPESDFISLSAWEKRLTPLWLSKPDFSFGGGRVREWTEIMETNRIR